MKEAVDMSPEEYKKFIFQSGVGNNNQGGGKIIKMNADGEKEMTGRERFSTGMGIVIGGAGLLILTDIILNKMKVDDFKGMKIVLPAILVIGAIAGGVAGNKLGKKWQATVNYKNKSA